MQKGAERHCRTQASSSGPGLTPIEFAYNCLKRAAAHSNHTIGGKISERIAVELGLRPACLPSRVANVSSNVSSLPITCPTILALAPKDPQASNHCPLMPFIQSVKQWGLSEAVKNVNGVILAAESQSFHRANPSRSRLSVDLSNV